MANFESWSGDWHARIYERVKAKGYESVTSFADAHPRLSLIALAEELGPDDVNGAQLLAILRDEAEKGGFVDRFARSLFVHEIYEAIPKGWRVTPDDGFDFEFNATGPLVMLITKLPESHEEMARNLLRIMMAAELPVGWLPDRPDDPVLVALFERAKSAAVTS
jgi:hypothetical protein